MEDLKYKDDRDRAFGVAGMAVAVCMAGEAPYCATISLDVENGREIAFTTDYFYRTLRSPRTSARDAWQASLNEFRTGQNMVLANLLCRTIVEDHSLPKPETLGKARQELLQQGEQECDLAEEEFGYLFDSELNMLNGVFSHPTIAQMTEDFANILLKRRSVDRDELYLAFEPLLSRL